MNANRTISLILGFTALFISFANFRLRLNDGVLNDPFHHGEYFAALLSLIHHTSFTPLTIHGALDYIPGALSIFIFGKGYYFFGTEIGYVLLAFAGSNILFWLISKFDLSAPQLIVVGFAIPWLVNYRDFSLIILVWLYFVVIDQKPGAKNLLTLLTLGLAGAFNFYWSTNRGIAGTISIGAALLVLSFRDRRYMLSAISFALFVLALSFANPILDIRHYIENLVILTQTSYQWRYELKTEPVLLSIYIGLLLIGANILIVKQFIAANRSVKSIANAVLMALLSVFYYQISTYRADLGHITMGLMVFILAISYWHFIAVKPSDRLPRLEQSILWAMTGLTVFILIIYKRSDPFLINYLLILIAVYLLILIYKKTSHCMNRKVYAAGLLVMIFPFIVFGYHLADNYHKGSYQWITHLYAAPPNAMLTTKPIQWVSDQLIHYKAKCVFDMTNNGVINAFSDLPACSRFSYIVYADRRFENELIHSLQESLPPAIVYSTSYWSYRIDGRSMASRFPILDRHIRDTYKYEACNEGYCLRYLSPPDKDSTKGEKDENKNSILRNSNINSVPFDRMHKVSTDREISSRR
jgi:hypothetical protein